MARKQPRQPTPFAQKRWELDRRLRYDKYCKTCDTLSTILGKAMMVGGVVGIAYIIGQAAESLGGKPLAVDIGLRFIADMSLDRWASYALAALTTGAYIRRKRLHKRSVKSLAPYKKKYQQLLDKNRSSSNLTETGDTHPEDEA